MAQIVFSVGRGGHVVPFEVAAAAAGALFADGGEEIHCGGGDGGSRKGEREKAKE